MTLVDAFVGLLKLCILHPVESITTVAALVFVNAFLFRQIAQIWIKSEKKRQDAQRKHEQQELQRKRKRMAEVQAKLNAIKYEDCDKQSLSPLFSTLPGELRNEVFRWALVQYDDEQNAYEEDSYWYRPGFHAPKKSSSSLLQTCKLVYLEARRVITREAEHAFWFDRGPEGRSGMHDFQSFFSDLSPQHVAELANVRFFTQMYWIEHGHDLNHWWNWESNEPLRMSEQWLKDFKGPPSLRELVVEYETIKWKRDEMMHFVNRNRKWKLALRDGAGHLSTESTALKEWNWQGPSRLGGTYWPHHGEGNQIEYVVVVDRWCWMPGELSEEDKALEMESPMYADYWSSDQSEEDEEDWLDEDEDDAGDGEDGIQSDEASEHEATVDDNGNDDDDNSTDDAHASTVTEHDPVQS